jgi:MFS transporter, MHS family, proline/betaine transporter
MQETKMTSQTLNASEAITADSDVVSMSRKAVICTVVGNSLEWFDFASYAYFAMVISSQFFPAADKATALIASFAVFGIGFVSRPLGAIFFGRLGDIKGRKAALLVAMPMMGFGTMMVGLLPTYQSIGIAAPILLVGCRLLQGFSAGGEAGNAVAYLIEWAPSNRRGLYGSFAHATAVGGTLLGSGLAAVLTTTMSHQALETWGWRLPFLIGGLFIAPLGYYLRSKVEETPRFEATKRTADLTTATYDKRSAWVNGAKVVGMSCIWFVSYYVYMVYVPAFLTLHGHIHGAAALWITTASFVVMIVCTLIAAVISDAIGRKPLLIVGSLSFIVLSYPLFLLFSSSTSVSLVFSAVVLCGGLIGIFAGTCPATMAEMFPTHLRTTGVSIGYGMSVTIFGGFASVISESLIKVTGSDLSPSFFVICTALISLGVALSLKETARRPLQ